jgi:PAS domain S-box-containing protein
VYEQTGNYTNGQVSLLDLIPQGILFLDQDRRILHINKYAIEKLNRDQSEVLHRYWHDVFPNLLTKEMAGDAEEAISFTYGEETFIARKSPYYKREELIGIVFFFQYTSFFEEAMEELDSYKNISLDLKAIFDTSYDVIYVADGEGKTLRVSAAAEKLWGYRESELIGKSVYQLEMEGVFKPSVTRLVLEKQERVTLIQTTKTGRRLMVVGTPIKDEEGTIIRVVNASRDITEVSELQSELEMMRQLTEGYRQEIMELRTKNEIENQIISRSDKMKKVVSFSQRIANVDSTVLLLGESGVGKEVIALSVHKWSNRKKKPFITVNCGAIPEVLLETELFGVEDGRLEASKRKLGSFEMANDGTLFIDEIEEMPLSLQVKLLRVLQSKQVIRKGGSSSPTGVNVRVITATNTDLSKLVLEGKFREDLYYLLNIVPIVVPPLRERKEDIIPLILHFTDQLNKKYVMQKRFNPLLLKQLQEYSWPGNVRELQNIIERLFVTTEETWIELKHLPEHIISQGNVQRSVQVNKIVPLKDAMEIVEKELLLMAKEKYGSTTKMAEVLGVNQSTISRKLQRLID